MNVRRVTIKDVAKKANVSKSAVSFAYNDPSKLSEATVEHIMQTAKKWDMCEVQQLEHCAQILRMRWACYFRKVLIRFCKILIIHF